MGEHLAAVVAELRAVVDAQQEELAQLRSPRPPTTNWCSAC